MTAKPFTLSHSFHSLSSLSLTNSRTRTEVIFITLFLNLHSLSLSLSLSHSRSFSLSLFLVPTFSRQTNPPMNPKIRSAYLCFFYFPSLSFFLSPTSLPHFFSLSLFPQLSPSLSLPPSLAYNRRQFSSR